MHASGHVVTTIFECLSQLNMIGPSFSCPFTDIILTFCNYRATGRPSKPVHISKLGKKKPLCVHKVAYGTPLDKAPADAAFGTKLLSALNGTIGELSLEEGKERLKAFGINF